jgi:hypothetical protein
VVAVVQQGGLEEELKVVQEVLVEVDLKDQELIQRVLED